MTSTTIERSAHGPLRQALARRQVHRRQRARKPAQPATPSAEHLRALTPQAHNIAAREPARYGDVIMPGIRPPPCVLSAKWWSALAPERRVHRLLGSFIAYHRRRRFIISINNQTK